MHVLRDCKDTKVIYDHDLDFYQHLASEVNLYLDEDVVDAVDVKVLDFAGLHVVEDVLMAQGPVETPVAVGGSGHLAARFEDDLALHVEAGNHPLLEENDLE